MDRQESYVGFGLEFNPMIRTYDSIPDFVNVARYCPYKSGALPTKWFGYIDAYECIERSLNGNDRLVPAAEKLLDQLDANVEILRPEWAPCVAGAYACVPEYLAGLPECMRRMVPAVNEVTPVQVYVSTTCSASIGTDIMLARGTAILALILKLQQMRPVQLNLLAETHGATDGEYLQVIRVESAPLNLAVACHCLTHVGFARHLTYGTARAQDGFNGAWPDSYSTGGAAWESHVREVLSMNPQDLYIGAAREWDQAITAPVAWVNAQVRAFADRED